MTSATARPSVVVVDDHAAFRASAVALLEADGFVVVGQAGTAAEALVVVRRFRPDVVVLDVRLPDEDGFAVAGLLAQDAGASPIVLVSSRAAATYGARLREAPVRGFLPKSRLSGAALRALLKETPQSL